MNYQILNSLENEHILNALFSLIDRCDGYEPYYSVEPDDSFLQLAAFENNTMIGFICLLGDETKNTYELSALVLPEYRRQGIFKEMFKQIRINCPNCEIVCPLPDILKNSSIVGRLHHSEYLLKLSKTAFSQIPMTLQAPTPEELEYEFCFTDDDLAYLFYKDDSADEPCAVLNIDYQGSFSNIYGVYVDDSLRGMGYGTILIKHFLQDYFHENDNPLVLNVSSLNPAALHLYKKCGFTEVSHIDYFNII